MSAEQWPTPPAEKLPEEITVEELPLGTDADGKKYLYEKDGVKYGGDFLPEPTGEVDPTFLAPPAERNDVI